MYSASKVLPIAATILFAISGIAAQAQAKSANTSAFRTSVMNLQKELVGWERIVDDLNVGELPVTYADGKVVEQRLSITKQNLHLASMLSQRILATGHLSDEINLLAVLADISQGFQQISNLLLSLNPTDHKTADEIAARAKVLSDVPIGRLSTLYLEVYQYVMIRADDIERTTCSLGTQIDR